MTKAKVVVTSPMRLRAAKIKPPKHVPVETYTPWVMMWYHTEERVEQGLCRQHKLDDALHLWQVLSVGASGGVNVAHLSRVEEWAHLSVPHATKTTSADFRAYLAYRLRMHGGSPEAYRLLDVDAPVVEVRPPTGQAAEAQEELYERAAKLLKCTVEDLRKKYGHLNQGLIAMNLRNRIRGAGFNT